MVGGWEDRRVSLPQMCLCFLTRRSASGEQEVLLGRKLRGLGEGNIVGLGGKVEAGETARSAAVRESQEEAGVVLCEAHVVQRAFITFRFPAKPSWDQEATVFVAESWRGQPTPTAEIVPRWYPRAAIPYDRMWQDARHWLPRVLDGEDIRAHFTFRDDLRTLDSWQVERARGED
jgi:8-oxo-dGTP diphosphatase